LSQELAAAKAAIAAQAVLAAAQQRLAARCDELTAARRAQRECEDEALKHLVLAPLPTDLVRLVFLLVPADARLRCREVCRGWCSFLADSFLWRVCDLSAWSGVVAERTPALLQAACERAQGTLEVLNVSGWRGLFEEEGTDEDGEEEVLTTLQVLLPVLQANAGSLVELRAWDCFEPSIGWEFLSLVNIEALLAAAPLLRLLECDAGADDEAAATTLRLLEEPQFAPVRLQSLYLHVNNTPLVVPALAARLSSHPSLTCLHLFSVDMRSELALDAVVDLTISQLQHLAFSWSGLSPASLSALTRMLGSGSLTELYIYNVYAPLLAGAAVPAFCAALRASRLVELTLDGVRLWHSLEDGLAVVAACTGHPTLRMLNLRLNGLEGAAGHEAIEVALLALAASHADLRLELE